MYVTTVEDDPSDNTNYLIKLPLHFLEQLDISTTEDSALNVTVSEDEHGQYLIIRNPKQHV
jgi:hypothetical protein